MRDITLENRTRDRALGNRIRIVDTWFGRLRGFLMRPAPATGEGLFVMPCRAVHMYGMAFPLDVAFLDAEGRVVATYPGLAPGNRSRFHKNAEYALELPAGTLAATETQVGDQLIWRPTATAARTTAREDRTPPHGAETAPSMGPLPPPSTPHRSAGSPP
jgi:uncharacterized protein